MVRLCPLCDDKIANISFHYEIPYKICEKCDLVFGDIEETPKYDESSHNEFYN